MPPVIHTDVDSCVDAVLASVGREIVLGIPIALGKPNHFVNALFARAVKDASIKLTIFTGLTFVKPRPKSNLERRFINPVAERLFGGYPELDYVNALEHGTLPPNIAIHEFFLQAGVFLSVPAAQQAYDSLNYTHAARHLLDLGLNVVAQLVAIQGEAHDARLSLSCNTDITLDIMPALKQRRDAGAKIALVRQTGNDVFLDLAGKLGVGRLHPHLDVETAPFREGLYGATELFVDGYLHLYRAGILKRRAFDDVGTQRRADAGTLSADEYAKGALLHAGFFFGSNSFYERLRSLRVEEREAFRMTGISYVNHLYGNEALKRAQRRHARFVNSTMMATLLGAAVSDQLADGRVVSGVGGQYNFVAQAHELQDGRSILELPAWRLQNGKPRSNIRWNYGHTTIPRHLRDIFVTEYGAADLRGLPDRDCIAKMLSIADSRFQDGLLRQAKDAGKIEPQYEIPRAFRNNTPDAVERALRPARDAGHLPQFPFGTDFTPEEVALLPALDRLASAQHSPSAMGHLLLRSAPWRRVTSKERPLLERLGLEKPKTAKDRVLAALVLGALRTQP